MKKLTLLLGVVLMFAQCDSENEIDNTLLPRVTDEITLEKIAQLGFDTQNFPVWENGEYYTVEEDIDIFMDDLDKASILSEGPETEQRRFFGIVSCNEIRYITVYNNLPSGTPRNTVSLAMRHWNEISKCDIFFANTNNINSAEIIISKGSIGSNAAGRASFPSGGKPGRYIRLDTDAFNFGYAQWRSTIEHELGHCIGFAHTNTTSNSTQIPGTLSSDGNSIMNAGGAGTIRSLSGDDKKAARLMYNLNFANRICN